MFADEVERLAVDDNLQEVDWGKLQNLVVGIRLTIDDSQ